MHYCKRDWAIIVCPALIPSPPGLEHPSWPPTPPTKLIKLITFALPYIFQPISLDQILIKSPSLIKSAA